MIALSIFHHPRRTPVVVDAFIPVFDIIINVRMSLLLEVFLSPFRVVGSFSLIL